MQGDILKQLRSSRSSAKCVTLELAKFPLRLRGAIVASYGKVSKEDTYILVARLGSTCGYGEANTIYRTRVESETRIINDVAKFAAFAQSQGGLVDAFQVHAFAVCYLKTMTARALVTMAWADLAMRLAGVRLRVAKAVKPEEVYRTNISAQDEATLADLYHNCHKIKVKVNGGKSFHRLTRELAAIQSITPRRLNISIDANRTLSVDEALSLTKMWQRDYLISHFEDPFADPRDNAELSAKTGLPIIGDDFIFGLSDFLKIGQYFDGINIKTSHVGSLWDLPSLISLAKELNKKIVLGCDYNTSLAIVPVLPFVSEAFALEYDAPWLTENDPFQGLPLIENPKLLEKTTGFGLSTTKWYDMEKTVLWKYP